MKRLILCLGLLLLFVMGVLLLTDVLFQVEANSRRMVVRHVVPQTFPVLLMVENPRSRKTIPVIMHYSEFKEFKLKHKYSLYIPLSDADSLNAYLAETPADFNGHRRTGHFAVKSLDNGEQGIRVSDTSDDDSVNTGYYYVSGGRISPMWHQRYSGPGVMLGIVPMALILNMIIWACAASIYQKRTGRIIRIWF